MFHTHWKDNRIPKEHHFKAKCCWFLKLRSEPFFKALLPLLSFLCGFREKVAFSSSRVIPHRTDGGLDPSRWPKTNWGAANCTCLQAFPLYFISCTPEVGKKHFSGKYLSKRIWMLHLRKITNSICICTHFPGVSLSSMEMWPVLEQLVQLSDSLEVQTVRTSGSSLTSA